MPQEIISAFDRKFAAPLETNRQVQNVSQRDAISASVRWEGMFVYVVTDGITYTLQGGIENQDWIPAGQVLDVIVENNLTSTSILNALSANQGRVLDEKFINYQLLSEKGANGGYVPLNASGQIDTQYLPSFVDDVLEFANLAAFPETGETGKLYIALDTNFTYRWGGSTYVQVGGGGAGAVDSVFGRVGAITAQASDYDAFYLRSDQSDTMAGTLTAQGITLNQASNFFQPSTHNDKILLIGGNGLGDRDWSNIFIYSGGVFRYNNNDIYHAGNDGAGSGLDADLLDGIQGANYARTDLTGAEVFAGRIEAQTYQFTQGGTANANDFATFMPGGNSIKYVSHSTGSTNYPTEFGNALMVRGATLPRSFALWKSNGNDATFYLGNYNETLSDWQWNLIAHAGNIANFSGLNADTLDNLNSTVFVRNDGTAGTRWDGVYLQFNGDGINNNDYISYNDATNAFYFNADVARRITAANAGIFAGPGNFVGDVSIVKNNAWFTVDSPGSGANGVEQAAGISVGESGYKGAAAIHLTYTGDGKGYLGMGAVSSTTSIPANAALEFQYQNTYTIFRGYARFSASAAYIRRTIPNSGYLVGSHAEASTAAQTNPIYTIGTSYLPAATTLGNMYGIGYAEGGSATWLNSTDLGVTPGGWGMYVASDGNARIFLNASSGHGYFKGNIYAQSIISRGVIQVPSTSSRSKLSVYGDGSQYVIGMQSGRTLGNLNDWAMTFQMNNDSDRGFLWCDTGHTAASGGAMALSTNGYLTLANHMRLGYGEADTANVSTTYTVQANGTMQATNFILSSDRRFKEKIKPYVPAKIRAKWHTFAFKDTPDEIRYGVIAQDLEIDHPEFITTDDDGTKSVKYIDLLIAKVAELEYRLSKQNVI